jgi:hypothetical protein
MTMMMTVRRREHRMGMGAKKVLEMKNISMMMMMMIVIMIMRKKIMRW